MICKGSAEIVCKKSKQQLNVKSSLFTGKVLAILLVFLLSTSPTISKYLVLSQDFQVKMCIMKMILQLQKAKHIVTLGCHTKLLPFVRKVYAQNETRKTHLSHHQPLVKDVCNYHSLQFLLDGAASFAAAL